MRSVLEQLEHRYSLAWERCPALKSTWRRSPSLCFALEVVGGLFSHTEGVKNNMFDIALEYRVARSSLGCIEP